MTHYAEQRSRADRAARRLSDLLRQTRSRVATAESCTGGLLASAFVDLPGASDVFERGFVTYSNAAKVELLTVPTYYIDRFGAVSKETAAAMAEGATLAAQATVGVSVTGIAGPEGGSDEKPVGLVYVGFAIRNKEKLTATEKFFFSGDRTEIRLQTVAAALETTYRRLSETARG
ncbi:MAG: CinA family protein [Rickettsiales bacterium]